MWRAVWRAVCVAGSRFAEQIFVVKNACAATLENPTKYSASDASQVTAYGRTWSALRTLKCHFAFTDFSNCGISVMFGGSGGPSGVRMNNVGTLEPSDAGSHPGPFKPATGPLSCTKISPAWYRYVLQVRLYPCLCVVGTGQCGVTAPLILRSKSWALWSSLHLPFPAP